ncbi:MAG: hypothetical protein KDB00_21405 [Planctomycetales bacterium]|nr:hypothetical protein [Planctomycetales bacterium]
MTNSQRLATVRDHLLRWLHENVSPKQSESGTELTLTGDLAGDQIADQTAEVAEDLSGETETVQESGESTSTESAAERPEDAVRISSESILIRDGFYAGRKFEAEAEGETFRATWFMEPDELKIHARGGTLLAVFQGDEISSDLRDDDVRDDFDQARRGPISIPMPAAGDASTPQSDVDSDDDRIQKAA